MAADVVLISVLEIAAEETEDGGQRPVHAADAFPNDERLIGLKEQTMAMIADLEDSLGEIAQSFGGARVETVVRYGDAGREIVHVARMHDNPVVVMTSHARRGFERAVVGSVAFSVVAESTWPVLVIPLATAHEGEPDLRRLLVPLDGSPLAEEALHAGIATVGNPPLDLHLVRVVETLTDHVPLGGDHYAAAKAEAEAYLESVAQRLREQGHQVEWRVHLGLPAAEIAAEATRIDASLIVMSTHGRSGIRRVVLGSAAERVLNTAHLPLLLVRPTEVE
jgi:nucleotide-binding universal stress UspA family protein